MYFTYPTNKQFKLENLSTLNNAYPLSATYISTLIELIESSQSLLSDFKVLMPRFIWKLYPSPPEMTPRQAWLLRWLLSRHAHPWQPALLPLHQCKPPSRPCLSSQTKLHNLLHSHSLSQGAECLPTLMKTYWIMRITSESL